MLCCDVLCVRCVCEFVGVEKWCVSVCVRRLYIHDKTKQKQKGKTKRKQKKSHALSPMVLAMFAAYRARVCVYDAFIFPNK